MKLTILLPILLASCGQTPVYAQTPAPPIPATPQTSGPQINWAGCGASYGASVAATCAFAIPVSVPTPTASNPQPHVSVYNWNATDATFAHRQRQETGSVGFYLDVWPQVISKDWMFHGGVITTANVTSTPSATIGSFTGGASGMVTYKKHLSFSVVMRQPTGSTLYRIWTAMAGWVF